MTLQVSVSNNDESVWDEHRQMFWRYISLACTMGGMKMFDGYDILTFHSIVTQCAEKRDMLLQVQMALFTTLLDKMRPLASDATGKVLDSLPHYLDVTTVLRCGPESSLFVFFKFSNVELGFAKNCLNGQ